MLYALYGGIFWVPVVLGLAGLGGVLLFRSLSRPGWLGDGASCGGCGYTIESLGDGRCPECGAVFVRVGILTPRAAVRLRGSAFLLTVGWTLLAGMIALPLLGVSFYLAQESMQQKMMLGNAQRVALIEGTLEAKKENEAGRRRSVVDFDMNIEAEVDADLMGFATGGWIEIAFTGSAGGHRLRLQGSGSWKLHGPDGVLGSGTHWRQLDPVTLGEFMSLDLDDTHVYDTLDALLEEVGDIFQSPQDYQMQMHNRAGAILSYNGFSFRWDQKGDLFGTGLTPKEFAPLATGVVVFLVYVSGLWFLLRWRRRLLRA